MFSKLADVHVSPPPRWSLFSEGAGTRRGTEQRGCESRTDQRRAADVAVDVSACVCLCVCACVCVSVLPGKKKNPDGRRGEGAAGKS